MLTNFEQNQAREYAKSLDSSTLVSEFANELLNQWTRKGDEAKRAQARMEIYRAEIMSRLTKS